MILYIFTKTLTMPLCERLKLSLTAKLTLSCQKQGHPQGPSLSFTVASPVPHVLCQLLIVLIIRILAPIEFRCLLISLFFLSHQLAISRYSGKMENMTKIKERVQTPI